MVYRQFTNRHFIFGNKKSQPKNLNLNVKNFEIELCVQFDFDNSDISVIIHFL